MKTAYFESFSRNNQQLFIILNGFVHKIDQKLHIRKFQYTVRLIFVLVYLHSAWKAAIFCVSAFVGMHQNNFDSGRQNERTEK